MNNTFALKFDKATTRLAGYPYGESVYEEQVENNIDFTKDIIIVFPDGIEKVASSFVQGFFKKVVDSIGYAGFDTHVIIKARSKELEDDIREKIR